MKGLIKVISLHFALILLFSSSDVLAQNFRIGEGIAVFYPDNFVSEKMLPSMALVKEPKELGKVPVNWKVIPEFYKNDDGKNCARIYVEEGTDLYGTGEVKGGLNRTGKEVKLWNTDNLAYRKDRGRRLYQSHPWIMAVRKDGSAFGILIDNIRKQKIKLNNPIEIRSEGPASRIIIIERKTPQELMTALAELTGYMELPPLWALGFQQCRYSYYPDTRVKEVASEFRKRKLPCDVIWMDIHYMQNYKIFTFDSITFPKPKELNDYLHSINFKSVWMIDPGVKKEKGYQVYDQGTAGNHWVLNSNGEEYNGNSWPGACAFPDFTRPETREWWGGLYKDYMALGVDGVWNDMNEPSVFKGPGGTMPEDNIHRGGGDLPKDIHQRYHNVYGMLMVKASRDGILKTNPDKRPFVLSRSNFLGGHRYAATWTGDNGATWRHLKMSTPMVLNLGLSGQPFSGPDIGGFIGSAKADLIAHWMAVGAFYPFSRNHTALETVDQEPWAFGKEVEDISRTALERRYRLMPYLYTLFHEASVTGLPVMRPVFFADAADTTLRDEDEAFMWGSDLLIVPKWAENPALPDGIWKSVSIVGEDSKNDAYQPDLKQRGGSIIPLGQKIQSTAELKLDSVTLLVCLDQKLKAKGVLYHDAGDGFAYKNEEYAITNFVAKKAGRNKISVSIKKSEGKLTDDQRYYRVGIVTDSGIVYSAWENKDKVKVTLPSGI